MSLLYPVLLLELLCIVGVAADYYLKLAGAESGRFVNLRYFALGFALHASTAVGWFMVLKYFDLAKVGVWYSISMVLLLTFIGVRFFGESLTPREYLGIALALGSLLLMTRFS